VSIFLFSNVFFLQGILDFPGGVWGLLVIILGSAVIINVILKSPPFKALASIFQALAVRIGGRAYVEQQRIEIEQKRRKIEIEFQGEKIQEVIAALKGRISSSESQKRLPQGTITILFSDIEGWTPMTDKGDERAYTLLQGHNQIFRQAITQHDGWEVKSYGDGFMLAFPSSRKAILCALEIQKGLEKSNQQYEQSIRVRIGIHSGEPIQQGDDYIGRAVNLASRIQNEANGGQILISEVVRNLAGPIQGVQYVDRGIFKLQGIEEKQRLYEVLMIQSLASGPEGTLSSGEVEKSPFSIKDN
jgi:class 3 adenylate cyclase